MKMKITSRSTTIMSDGSDENEKTEAESRGSESTSTETASIVAVVICRETGDGHSDRIAANLEADGNEGEGHHGTPHSVAEAGSFVLHVSNNMDEGKRDGEHGDDGEEEGETAAAKETEYIYFKKKTRKSEDSPRRETTTERSEKKHQKMYQRQKKD